MTSCRGVLVAGVTNRARTQMAEGFLGAFTAGRVYVTSGGVSHEGALHPMAVRAMRGYGIDISRQAPSSLQAARDQRATYDVYVSIDASYGDRRADQFQRSAGAARAAEGGAAAVAAAYGDPLLAPAMPSHWSIGLDATDVRRRWNLWSPRDPAVFHERSTRKFQDHLYEGEPLFMRLDADLAHVQARVAERWELADVQHAFAMERPYEQQRRVGTACEALCLRTLRLLRRLEGVYGEPMLLNEEALRAASEQSAQVRAYLAEGHAAATAGPAGLKE